MPLTKRPTMTPKRIAASQANGRLSSGPRTGAGKARQLASRLRHGFYSRAQRETLQALGEDPREFQDLLDSLVTTWQPEDYQEMSLVMRLARAIWRMNRADRIQESVIIEQVYRPLPLPTPLDIVDDVLLAHANRMSVLAARICKPGYFTGPEDFELFTRIFGTCSGSDPEDEQPRAILDSMRRLAKPGADGGSPQNDPHGTAELALLEDDEQREQERRKLRIAFFNQIAEIHAKTTADNPTRGPSKKFQTPHGFESLMAPQDRNGSLMLLQRWEDSNLRQILRITELLTKLKSGKLGWSNTEK